jgi:hypothetical protein
MCGLESSVGTLSTSIVMLGAPPLKNHDRSHENMISMMCLRNVESAFKGGLSRAYIQACRFDLNYDLRAGREWEETTILV